MKYAGAHENDRTAHGRSPPLPPPNPRWVLTALGSSWLRAVLASAAELPKPRGSRMAISWGVRWNKAAAVPRAAESNAPGGVDGVREAVRAVELEPARVVGAGELDALEGRLGAGQGRGEVVVLRRQPGVSQRRRRCRILMAKILD